jgi:hypothetical protein
MFRGSQIQITTIRCDYFGRGLFDIDRIDLAREILDLIPARKLVITTAYDYHALTREAESVGISKDKVLLKPFMLSKLWSAVMDN